MERYESNHVKGQVFAPDFLVSVAVFTIMLSVFILTWNSLIAAQEDARIEENLYQNAERTMNQLLSSPGKPSNWDEDSVTSIGLASSPHVLDMDKVEEMSSMNETQQDELRSLLSAPNFRLEIRNDTHTIEEIGSEIDSGLVIPLRRDVMLQKDGGEQRVEVEYTVWQ